jgi:hypothetical protein
LSVAQPVSVCTRRGVVYAILVNLPGPARSRSGGRIDQRGYYAITAKIAVFDVLLWLEARGFQPALLPMRQESSVEVHGS